MKFIKKWRFCVFLFIIIFGYLILLFNNFIDISTLLDKKDISVHFNIITIASIFGSFLFGSLSLMIGLNNSTFIRDMERAGYMDNIYVNLYSGICTSFFSVIIATALVFLEIKNLYLQKIIAHLELLMLVLSISIFLKAIGDTYFIIKAMRKRMKYDLKQTDDVKKAINIINNGEKL